MRVAGKPLEAAAASSSSQARLPMPYSHSSDSAGSVGRAITGPS